MAAKQDEAAGKENIFAQTVLHDAGGWCEGCARAAAAESAAQSKTAGVGNSHV